MVVRGWDAAWCRDGAGWLGVGRRASGPRRPLPRPLSRTRARGEERDAPLDMRHGIYALPLSRLLHSEFRVRILRRPPPPWPARHALPPPSAHARRPGVRGHPVGDLRREVRPRQPADPGGTRRGARRLAPAGAAGAADPAQPGPAARRTGPRADGRAARRRARAQRLRDPRDDRRARERQGRRARARCRAAGCACRRRSVAPSAACSA